MARLKLATKPRAQLPRLTDKVLSEEIIADVTTALLTIHTTCITELIDTPASVILEGLEYMIKNACRESPLWRRRLEFKIRKAQRILVG